MIMIEERINMLHESYLHSHKMNSPAISEQETYATYYR